VGPSVLVEYSVKICCVRYPSVFVFCSNITRGAAVAVAVIAVLIEIAVVAAVVVVIVVIAAATAYLTLENFAKNYEHLNVPLEFTNFITSLCEDLHNLYFWASLELNLLTTYQRG
jgi:hypothetical protein